MARPFRPEALVLGLALIALGVVWTLGNLGRSTCSATLRTWWPLTLVVWGVLELIAFAPARRDAAEGR